MDNTKEVDKKEWYMSGWGLAIAIIFLPFFSIWYVWNKTNWDNKYKWITTATIAILVISISAANGGFKEKETNNTPKTTPVVTTQDKAKVDADAAAKLAAENEAKRIAEEEAKRPIFDIPSLIGKNIDEIRTALGSPADKEMTEPNQAQLQLGTKEWDNTFEKDNKELLVTFNVKERTVIDFFISTDDPSGQTKDKTHLLELGNLSTSSNTYKIEYVKTIKDPSQFTGVKIIPN